MKKIILFAIFLICACVVKAQRPTGVPQLFNGKWYKFNQFLGVDSALLVNNKDTNWLPRQPALVFWQNPASDTSFWVYNGSKWNKVGVVLDTTSLSNRINFKANDSDVVHKSGTETITGQKTFNNADVFVQRNIVVGSATASGIPSALQLVNNSSLVNRSGYNSIWSNSSTTLNFLFNQSSTNYKTFQLNSGNLTNNIQRNYILPDKNGWILLDSDTTSLSNRINLKLNISDTASMLNPYLRKADTASLSNRINLKLNISDTAAMLANYLPLNLRTTTTTVNLNNKYFTINGLNPAGAYTSGRMDVAQNFSGLGYQKVGTFYGLTVDTLGSGTFYSHTSKPINYVSDYSANFTANSLITKSYVDQLISSLDTTSLSNRINLKLNISDTAAMLSPYQIAINARVKYTDTASMLAPYLRKADTASLSNRINLKLNISDTAAMLSPYLKAAVTSVGLSMPAAFNVTNSPVTSTGTIAVTGAGTAAQYIRGDGQLATLPSGASGGSSVAYYLNGSVNQGTIGGSVYYEMNRTPVIGAGTDFSLAGNGLISQFITDVADPNRLEIPAGNWNFEIYMSASSSGGTPEFYVELLKYDGTNFTSIASSSANPEAITNGTTIDLYVTALAIPQTTLLATDRLVIRVYIVNSTGGRTITMHTENSHLCEIITNFAGGVSALNGLTANTQYLATGTSGNDFAINSLTDTHTFNLPTASSTKRGALSSADWSTFNGKMNYSDTASLSNRINLKLNSSDTVSLSNRINTKLNSTDTASLSNRINAKADALSGTTNTVPKFTSGTTIGNSNIKDNGNAVTINATAGSFGALQVGNYNGNILMNTTNSSAGLIFQNTSSSNKLWDFSSNNNDLVFNESNVAPVMTLKAGGNVLISNLSGSGTRMVTADANGVLSTQAISSDTTSLSNRINLKLNISDTASMLSGYQSAINSKQGTITLTTTGTSGAANFSSNTLNIPQYQAAGTYVTSVTGTSPIVSSGGTTPAISIPAASSSVNGYLSSTDWSTFNGKESALTFSSPLVRTTNTISIPVATTSVNGYLSATDWTTFNNKQSTLTNPVTGTGTNNYIAKFTATGSTIGNSSIADNGAGRVSIGTASFLDNFVISNGGTTGWEFSNTGSVITYNRSTSAYIPMTFQASSFGFTGAATFSSSVKMGGGVVSGTMLTVANSTNAREFQFGYSTGAGYNYLQVYDGTSFQPLNINNTMHFTGGNVGIGTTSPTQLLSVSAPAALMDVTSTTSTQFNGLEFKNGGGSFYVGQDNSTGTFYGGGDAYAGSLYVSGAYAFNIYTNATKRLTIASTGAATFSSSATVAGAFVSSAITPYWYFQSSGAGGSTAYVGFGASLTTGAASTDFIVRSENALAFNTNGNNERMRITSGGNVLIGRTTSGLTNTSGTTIAIGSIQVEEASYVFYGNRTTTDGLFMGIRRNNVDVGSITVTTSATAFNTSSDYRLKTDFKEFNALSIIDSIKAYDYAWKIDKTRAYGVKAHELQSLLPYAVFGEKDEVNEDGSIKPQAVDYSKIVPILIKGMQEQQAQIKELQTEIQTLKNK